MHKQADITFEDGHYVFNYTDEYGWVVTDWKTVEELRYNIREAMQLHFDGVEKISHNTTTNRSRDFTMPMTLSFSNSSYASHLQTD